MKHNILTILVISLFSSTVFAATSHDFGHSAGAKDAGFVVTKDETRSLSDDEIKKNQSNSVAVKAVAYDTNEKMGLFVKINGSHRYCIDNYSRHDVQAGYRFSLKALGEEVHSEQTFIVPSFLSRCIEEKSFMMVYPRSSGHFPITAISKGQDGDSTREDRSNATLLIDK